MRAVRNDDGPGTHPDVFRPYPDQPALSALPRRQRTRPAAAVANAGPTDQGDRPDLAGREHQHRYLLVSPDTGGIDEDDEFGATGPNGTGRYPSVRAENGNTEPLLIRPPVQRPAPDAHPVDRAHPGVGPAGRVADAGSWSAPPGNPGATDLGLRPESVARLSASGRELLARLQAELQGKGTAPGPRPGGLGPTGGGMGINPHGQGEPPDLAG